MVRPRERLSVQPADPSPSATSARADDPTLGALVSVLAWEARRVVSGRVNWIVLGGTFAAFALFLWLGNLTRGPDVFQTTAGTYTIAQSDTSVWGLLLSYPQFPGLLFGLALPFVTTDSVGRDLHRRTHEFLMATSLPTWAYVWGRFLASLMFSTMLAGVILLAVLMLAAISHAVDGAEYAPVAIGGLTASWALVILPPVFLLSGVSFALGTLVPRRSGLVKVGVLLAWFAAGATLWYLLNPTYRDLHPKPAPYVVWDPTSIAPSFPLSRQLQAQLAAHTQTLDRQSFDRYALSAQEVLPDVKAWIGPHIVWMAVGLLAAVVAAATFRRFRNVVGR